MTRPDEVPAPPPVQEGAASPARTRSTHDWLHGDGPGSEGSPAVFVRWLLACILLAAGAILAANWWLDPTGVTGRTTRFGAVENVEVRQVKLDIMERAEQPPDVLVLGSSRSMMLDPETIEQLTGQRALNAAVSGATTKDAYLYAAYAAERWPDDYPHLVLGLVNDVFREPDASPLDARLQGLLGEDETTDVLPMLEQLLQLQTTRASLLAARREVRAGGWEVLRDPIGLPATSDEAAEGLLDASRPDHYRADGMQLFDPSIDLDRPLRGRVQHQMQKYLAGSFPEGDEFDGVSGAGLERFRDMVRIANEHGDVPAIFITPFHPQAADMLPAEYHERERRMRAVLRRLQASGLSFSFHEYDDIAVFGGDPEEFYDGIHMTKANTDRLVTLLDRDGALAGDVAERGQATATPGSIARASHIAEGGSVAPGR